MDSPFVNDATLMLATKISVVRYYVAGAQDSSRRAGTSDGPRDTSRPAKHLMAQKASVALVPLIAVSVQQAVQEFRENAAGRLPRIANNKDIPVRRSQAEKAKRAALYDPVADWLGASS